MNIAIYDLATGAIFQTCQSNKLEDALAACSNDQQCVEVGPEITDISHKIENGIAVPIVLSNDEILDKKWDAVRVRRNILLSETDWMAVRAYEQGVPMSAKVVAYRQALRDITTTAIDPDAIVWPTL